MSMLEVGNAQDAEIYQRLDRRDILGDACRAVLHLALRRILAIQTLIDLRILRIAHFQHGHRLTDQVA
ncbi:hypothetical protein, partial [Xanthomonas arboricola]|uniref:hypothetical protein n=1 Tax=Xanthomonas arboricola TaxID=56448 RepID=UPI001C616AFB